MTPRRAKRGRAKQSTKSKGDIVEEVAAWLHDWPGVTVERNVRLLAHSDPSRRREIDVLLTTAVAGYPVRFAIECKNEATRIGSPMIDGFIGKLDDIGIPPQQGIFISASGYTRGAVRRAEKADVRTLLLRGLSIDGLKASILTAAHQSVVFFMVVAESVTFFNKSEEAHLPAFIDTNGRLCGTVAHLIASQWAKGEIPSTPGSYEIKLPIPHDWRMPDACGQPIELLIHEVYVKLRVQALAATVSGRAEEYSLVDPASNRPEKFGVRVFFEAPEARYPLTVFRDQADLDRFLNSRQGYRITQRIKVPRIHYHSAYWPLSRRAAERLRDLARTPKFVEGELVLPSALEVEGLDIAAAWEKPMSLEELDELLLTPLRSCRPQA